MENIGELMYKGYMDGMLQMFIIFKPYIINFLAASFGIWIIKKIFGKLTYEFSIIYGDSRRIARKKARKTGKTIDMISSLNDILNSAKNK